MPGGIFVEAARRAGIHATGVELAEACVRFATDRLGLPVPQKHFDGVAASTRVEAVCAFHVLEHVDDPRKFVITARSVLAPGGWLALEVPNIDSSAARREGRSWHGLQPAYLALQPEVVEPTGERSRIPDQALPDRPGQPLPESPARYRLSPKGAWTALKESLPRTPHPRLHDLLRLLAQLPEQPHGVGHEARTSRLLRAAVAGRQPVPRDDVRFFETLAGAETARDPHTPRSRTPVAGQSEEE